MRITKLADDAISLIVRYVNLDPDVLHLYHAGIPALKLLRCPFIHFEYQSAVKLICPSSLLQFSFFFFLFEFVKKCHEGSLS
jgi:hypothetical protein